MKLSDEEREFMRVVFDDTGGIPFKYIALTELPIAAEALSLRGFIELRQSGRDTWVVAITGEGSAWAHLHFVGRGASAPLGVPNVGGITLGRVGLVKVLEHFE
jgi:hypothetical protein